MAEINYCLVENGVVVYGPAGLPNSWGNTVGLDKCSPEGLKERGWLVHEMINPSYDAITHRREGFIVDIQEDKVVYTDNIIAHSTEELTQNAMNDWGSTLYGSDMIHEHIGLPRQMEDMLKILIDKFPGLFDEELPNGDLKWKHLKDRYDKKQAIRATKP